MHTKACLEGGMLFRLYMRFFSSATVSYNLIRSLNVSPVIVSIDISTGTRLEYISKSLQNVQY